MIFKTIKVQVSPKSYPIYIGQDLFEEKDLLLKYIPGQQVLIVSNTTVADLFLQPIQTNLETKQCDVILLPDGEEYKDLKNLEKIFDMLLTKRHHRNTTLIALGGGVVCDMTGFAAACYQRGVNFIQIPTSLLAQVDASIGGKTAVNHPLGKNMIGAFHQPECVIVDTKVLKTLPKREITAGVAEIIKAACIKDANFFIFLEKNLSKLIHLDTETLLRSIAESCQIKADIVAADEKEKSGERALLNFGHTFGHAIEQSLGYGIWLHGEAVGLGMILAADLSKRLGMLDEESFIRIYNLIAAANLPTQLPRSLQCDKIYQAMTLDKKITNGKLQFVLLREIGNAELFNQVDLNLVKEVIANYQ